MNTTQNVVYFMSTADYIKIGISKNINSLKQVSLRVENQSVFEFKKELKEKDVVLLDIENKKSLLSSDLKKIKEKLLLKEMEEVREIEDKIKKENNRLRGNFTPSKQKINKVMNKFKFLFDRKE